MRYVLHSMRMLLRSATQYRASFVMQTLSQVIMTGGDLMAVLVLMDRFTALGQWTADEILFFFGVMQVPFALCEFLNRGLGTFSGMIVRGGFDTLLLRPKSLLLQVICSQLDPRRDRLGGDRRGGAGRLQRAHEPSLDVGQRAAAPLGGAGHAADADGAVHP